MHIGEHGGGGQRWLARGVLMAAALVLVPAAPAAAQVPTVPGVTLPTRIFTEPVTPEAGGTTPPTATTVPTPLPTSAEATPPSTSARPAAARPGARRASGAPGSTAPSTVVPVAPAVAAVDDEQAAPAEDAGAVPTARELGFPLALAGLVSAFVAVQGRLDRRDPKLAAAPISVDDDLLGFE